MPFYRVTIWLKNNRVPLTGIRFINQTNIDLATIYLEGIARSSFATSQVVDVEVAMLSKNSSAVRKHRIEILKISGKLNS
jgi:hypothetical protein